MLPLLWCQRFGRLIGITVRIFLPRQRALVKCQLFDRREVLGLDNARLDQMEKLHWADLGQRLGEWFAGDRALSLFWISPEAQQILTEARSRTQSGEGLVVCTAHYGQWELMAVWLSRQGYDFIAVASSPPKGPLGKWLSLRRASMGINVVHPRGGARVAIRHLGQGGVIALLIDHATSERSSLHTFLGREAPFSHTADRMVSAAQARALWICSRRDARGRYEVIVRQLSGLTFTNQDPIPNAREAHGHLEQLICESPHQWLWLHRRWKDRMYH